MMIKIILAKPKIDYPSTITKFKDNLHRIRVILKDNKCGRNSFLMGKFWKSLFRILGINISPYQAYHPKTDGLFEIMSSKGKK